MTTRNPPKAGETYHYMATAKDIDEGRPAAGSDCPVALAIRRRHGGLGRSEVHVSSRARYYGLDSVRLVARLPARVGDFIDEIDRGSLAKPKPIRFALTWVKP
jgi:hypothetical protein